MRFRWIMIPASIMLGLMWIPIWLIILEVFQWVFNLYMKSDFDNYVYFDSYIFLMGAITALAAIGFVLVTDLLDWAGSKSSKFNKAINDRDVPGIIEYLNGRNWRIKCISARALAEIKDPRAIVPLINAIDNKDSEVRRCVLNALVAYGDRATAPLISNLSGRYDVIFATMPTIKEPISFKMDYLTNEGSEVSTLKTMIGFGPGSINSLIRGLNDPDPNVKKVSFRLLKEFDNMAIGPLLQALKHTDKNVRASALSVLGAIKEAKTVDEIRSALNDESDEVRIAAAMALKEFNIGLAPGERAR